jgi:tetratricopeptide (TPR) repeat protein
MGAGRAVQVAGLLLVLGAAAAAGSEPGGSAPDTESAQWDRAVALEQAGHLEEAIEAYRAAAAQGHPEAAALDRIGSCHKRIAERADTPAPERLDHRLRAARALTRAIRLDPRDVTALAILGDLALEADDARGALAVYQHLDALAPDAAATLLRLGHAHARLGEHELALSDYRRALQRAGGDASADPGDEALRRDVAAYAHLGAAESLIALKRRNAARQELTQVLAVSAGGAPAAGDAERMPAATRARMLLGALEGSAPPAAAAE